MFLSPKNTQNHHTHYTHLKHTTEEERKLNEKLKERRKISENF
jgi:hypothetical protein